MMNWKDTEGSGRGLIWGTTLVFTYLEVAYWENHENLSQDSGLRVEI
jgi:hypothetical protein